MNPNVELHIEELVLHGFSSADRRWIGEAVERELARLLIEQGVPSSLAQEGEMACLDGAVFKVAPGSTAEMIGAQVGRVVYEGLNR